jgi:hypothetical protein
MHEHPFELDAVAILYHLMHQDDLYLREKEQGQIEHPFLGIGGQNSRRQGICKD